MGPIRALRHARGNGRFWGQEPGGPRLAPACGSCEGLAVPSPLFSWVADLVPASMRSMASPWRRHSCGMTASRGSAGQLLAAAGELTRVSYPPGLTRWPTYSFRNASRLTICALPLSWRGLWRADWASGRGRSPHTAPPPALPGDQIAVIVLTRPHPGVKRWASGTGKPHERRDNRADGGLCP